MEFPRRIRRRVSSGVLALALAGCASPGSPEPPFVNPATCAEAVARHASNLDAAVDAPVEARTLRVAPLPKGTYTFRFVVDESGRATPEGVSIEPEPPNAIAVIRTLASSTFRPARSGACWVPSTFTYSAIIG